MPAPQSASPSAVASQLKATPLIAEPIRTAGTRLTRALERLLTAPGPARWR